MCVQISSGKKSKQLREKAESGGNKMQTCLLET